MTIERRSAPRYNLVADAELKNSANSVSVKGRTSDVSLAGCFVHTRQSLPEGAEVQIQLAYRGTAIETGGAVVRSEPSSGMGISFRNTGIGQQSVLQNWLQGWRAG